MGILVRRVGAVLTAGLAFALWHSAAWADFSWSFPDPVTPIAHETLKIHNVFMVIITVIFVTVFAIMLYSFYAHRKSAGHKAADFTQPKNRKQWFWVLVPFGILLFIDYVVFGIPAYHAVHMYEDSKTDADMVVKVIGSQWKWQYEYPEEGIKFVSVMTTPREQIMNQEPKGEHYLLEVDHPLVLPVDTKVRFITTSTDVIHSWWVPAFGVKRDAVPGFLREFWAKIDKPGIYRGQCAELCGKDHAFMPVVVHAVSQAEYKEWVAMKQAEQVAAAAAAEEHWSRDRLMALGQDVYNRACAVCHQPGGQGLPPVFPPITGSPMATAPFVDDNGNMIKDGHLDRVMNGKAGTAMQAFKATLNDAEIAAVVTYERNALGNAADDDVQPMLVRRLRDAGQ